eukprot:CAMPEP_0171097028 /NCGR_PEP_ID=MMETSP0766_2-20121228/46678_1 /TAXON_ID=439317 /ORGANISM="Gambierdiscus australes, Strain CAWD 149" /LENGTH=363 /DNA_ID=CAMNT_0011556139 /DNA_START=53 /DNA_END=1144 /DNA_ORIENTATION=-
MTGAGSAQQEQEAPTSSTSSLLTNARKFFLCIVYIVVSGVLIRFNKFMMKKGHFPHALALSAIHMVACSFFCSVFYCVAPSMFPGMKSTEGQRLSLLKWFVPIGCCFAVMLFGSNQAYTYCSVTFLQFMKEANVMLVFVFSCIIGLQSFNRLRCLVIIWVIVGASISVSGEVHFKWLGFIFQAVSQLAEVSRMLMGEMVMGGRKLDPLTYNMFLAPICLIVLIIANGVHWSPGTWVDLNEWWPLVIANACVAFCLNVCVAAVIKECSAVGFVLAGLTKDIAIVVFSAGAFHEHVTRKQALAFVITIAGVFFWSYMKIHPSAPLVRALERALCVEPTQPGEKAALLAKDASLPFKDATSAEKKV